VAELVVDLLEAVQVEEQQRLAAGGRRHPGCRARAVGQPGQGVGAGGAGQLLRLLLAALVQAGLADRGGGLLGEQADRAQVVLAEVALGRGRTG
jgi:hypothetical protein